MAATPSDSERLDFLQRHPFCVVAVRTTRGEAPLWYAEQIGAMPLRGKTFSTLRVAIDFAMTAVEGIKMMDLMQGDYCRANIPVIGEPGNTKVRLCQVFEVHGHILQVTTATRKQPVAIKRSDVVGLGWRKA